ncbi:MAG TPA: 2OG-Fe(II) oxygenase [Alphaproteobacteria bacterium]|nr:2OG-Fe(II) oxygenase [Alphaproteobacteria bacterium]
MSGFARGDLMPAFVLPSTAAERFHFDTVAGHRIALCFIGSGGDPRALAMAAGLCARREALWGAGVALFLVSCDPADRASGRLEAVRNGATVLWDFEAEAARRYGRARIEGGTITLDVGTTVLERNLRFVATVPAGSPEAHADAVAAVAAGLAAEPPGREIARQAPVLLIPEVFDPELCRRLIAIYEADGGTVSGFMRQEGGRMIGVHDPSFKRRRDCILTEAGLLAELRGAIERRVVPEVRKAFGYRITRMERHIVACYDAGEGGFFRAHRDNTTAGTAHRQFAMTVNLNAEAFEGGALRFPEYGPDTYRAPTGGAVVFSCALLHEAQPVTRGRRYAYLPFFYDEAGQALRERNQAAVAPLAAAG